MVKKLRKKGRMHVEAQREAVKFGKKIEHAFSKANPQFLDEVDYQKKYGEKLEGDFFDEANKIVYELKSHRGIIGRIVKRKGRYRMEAKDFKKNKGITDKRFVFFERIGNKFKKLGEYDTDHFKNILLRYTNIRARKFVISKEDVEKILKGEWK